jgi:hypothetical protein
MSDTALKNPCRECDHHLAGGSKNACECTDCEERIAYVDAIGTCPGESVNEGVSMEGGGGPDFDKILKTLSEIEQTANQDQTKPDPPEKAEDPQTEKDQFIEDHIKTMCKDAGMTIEQIRAGIKGQQNAAKTQPFHDVRDRIIKSLASGDFGKLNQTQIGKYLGVSNHVISMRMGVMGIAPGKPGQVKKTKKPKSPEPAKPKKDKKTPDPAKLTLRLDFTEFPEIYNDLQTLATQEIRTIKNQALYIFKQIHKRGLNIEEL